MLKNYKLSEYNEKISNQSVHNLTGSPISAVMRSLLSKGVNFVPTPTLNKTKCAADLHDYIRRLKWKLFFCNKKEKLEDATLLKKFYLPTQKELNNCNLERTQVAMLNNMLFDGLVILNTLPTNPKHNLTIQERTALKKLETEDNVFLPSDKNLGLTLLKRKTLHEACVKWLENSTQFKEVSQPIDEFSFKQTIKQIKESTPDYSKLNSRIIKYINNYKAAPNPADFYMIPKLHKLTLQWRPIIPACGTWNVCLANVVDHYLQTIVKQTPSYLKNTTQLIDEIEELNKQTPTWSIDNLWLITADVEQLYPSIPLEEAYIIVKQYISTNHKDIANVLSKFLKWILFNNRFNYQNKTYIQLDGVATGSPVAPSVANLFMAHIETKLVSEWATKKHVLLYKRYIDDIIMVFNGTEEQVEKLKSKFSKMHKNITLTWNTNKKEVVFLDLVIYKDAKLSYRVHQKELNNYLYLPWTSSHPKNTKTGIIKGELKRYMRNCSNITDYIKVKKCFAYRLQQRGYPPEVINKFINAVRYKDRNEANNTNKALVNKEQINTQNTQKTDIIVFKTYFSASLQSVKWSRILHPDKVNKNKNKRIICLTAYKKTSNMFSICKRLLGKTAPHTV